jgi:hypothetical protein
MVLTHPDFTVERPPGLSSWITDAMWWFWLRLQELEPTSQLGGIAAVKRGFHSTGQYNLDNYPNDYSIRDAVNRSGPWWRTKSSALDWTFPEAHQRNYVRIAHYMQMLLASARDPNDPRLDTVLFGFFGQADNDTHVEGWNEYHEFDQTSDISHWFHIHFDVLRSKCGDFWAMWNLLTVLMGWTVAQWRASLPGATPTPQEEDDMNSLVYVRRGAPGGEPQLWALAGAAAGPGGWVETDNETMAIGWAKRFGGPTNNSVDVPFEAWEETARQHRGVTA